MHENLEKMQKFFKYNLQIKNILYNTVPKESDGYNKSTLIEYSDKLFQAINDIEYYINVILDSFDFALEDKKYFNKFIKALKQELIRSGYKFTKLSLFYETCFSNMAEELVNKVGNEIKGGGEPKSVALKEAKSINEICHIIHQTIINNENNFRNLPVISQKQNHEGYNITLYGIDTPISRLVFNSIPYSLSSDYVEIMSISDEKVIMMVRDVGHALSIEIEKENNKYYVRYFIPKICNINMVNSLKGVKPVTKGDNYTIGVFETTLDNISMDLSNFITSVPVDRDMFKEGGIYYSYNTENEQKKM